MNVFVLTQVPVDEPPVARNLGVFLSKREAEAAVDMLKAAGAPGIFSVQMFVPPSPSPIYGYANQISQLGMAAQNNALAQYQAAQDHAYKGR